MDLRTFAPKSSLVQIFCKLLLQLDNDQLMSEKQKKKKKKMGGHHARFWDKAYWKRYVFRSFGYVRRNRLSCYKE